MGLDTIIEPYTCAFCSAWVGPEPEYTIHRDGFGEGPEVPLCVHCGNESGPTCEEIWARTACRRHRAMAHNLN